MPVLAGKKLSKKNRMDRMDPCLATNHSERIFVKSLFLGPRTKPCKCTRRFWQLRPPFNKKNMSWSEMWNFEKKKGCWSWRGTWYGFCFYLWIYSLRSSFPYLTISKLKMKSVFFGNKNIFVFFEMLMIMLKHKFQQISDMRTVFLIVVLWPK